MNARPLVGVVLLATVGLLGWRVFHGEPRPPTLLPPIAASGLAEVPVLETNLDSHTFAAWRAHIQPAPEELAYEQLDWLPTFGEGLAAAQEQGRPLLVWGMNGHPLGCT